MRWLLVIGVAWTAAVVLGFALAACGAPRPAAKQPKPVSKWQEVQIVNGQVVYLPPCKERCR